MGSTEEGRVAASLDKLGDYGAALEEISDDLRAARRCDEAIQQQLKFCRTSPVAVEPRRSQSTAKQRRS